MIRSIIRAGMLGAAALGAVAVTQAASATKFVGNFLNGGTNYNNGTVQFTLAGDDKSTMNVNIYGRHLNADLTGLSGATARYWKDYGVGVLYGTDRDDGTGTHQIDNKNGIDFVALQFDQDVTLSTISRKAWGGTQVGTDTDLSFMLYTGQDLSSTANWNYLSSGDTTTDSTAKGKIWLVAADVGKWNRDDAFKLTGITASKASNSPPAVPEPASWAMMIVGFGAVGYGMRRRQSVNFAAV